MRYLANPAHKTETTEAGPPLWRPDKEPCPEGMTLRERTTLLRESIAENPDAPHSRRFAVCRTESGLHFFAAQVTQIVNGEADHHHDALRRVSGRMPRRFRDQVLIPSAVPRRSGSVAPGPAPGFRVSRARGSGRSR